MKESEASQNKESDDPEFIKRLEYTQQPYELLCSDSSGLLYSGQGTCHCIHRLLLI